MKLVNVLKARALVLRKRNLNNPSLRSSCELEVKKKMSKKMMNAGLRKNEKCLVMGQNLADINYIGNSYIASAHANCESQKYY